MTPTETILARLADSYRAVQIYDHDPQSWQLRRVTADGHEVVASWLTREDADTLLAALALGRVEIDETSGCVAAWLEANRAAILTPDPGPGFGPPTRGA